MGTRNNVDFWIEETVRKAIQQGKLFELIFTPQGRRLWAGYPENRIRQMVIKHLGSKKRRDR